MYVCTYVRMYVFLMGGVPCETGGNAGRKI